MDRLLCLRLVAFQRRRPGVMAVNLIQDTIAGFEAPVHRALTEPILLAGVPRSVAIINGTLAAAIGLGLRLWLVWLVLLAVGHMAAAWAAQRDPVFAYVLRPPPRSPP